VLGLHGTAWTPASVYERYFTLENWRRADPATMSWFADEPAMLLRRFLDDPSELNYLAVTAVIAAALGPRGPALRKDAACPGALPGFAALRRLFEDLSTGGTDTLR
jgi:hypothetical protein